ncbi:MAG: tandem-95 repeat protein [Pseudomonadota bacterium]|nr:tandem-95 repeat protein [Pseudomonadota bacterium]
MITNIFKCVSNLEFKKSVYLSVILLFTAGLAFSFQNCGDGYKASELASSSDNGGLNSGPPINKVPQANSLAVAVTEDLIKSGVLAGSDSENSPLTFKLVQQALKGSVVINLDGSYVYTPQKDANGVDSFTFNVNDGELTSSDATISIIIAPVNDLPVATNANLNTAQDVAVNASLSARDVDGDTLAYSIVDIPKKGKINNLNLVTGAYTYVPDAGAVGSDSFTFRVKDASDFSNTATVSVNLNNVNDAPVAQNITALINEDVSASIKLLATDADGDALVYRLLTQPTRGVVSNFIAGTGAFTYTPTANFSGADSFQYVARDGSVDSAAKSVTITIAAVNDAPVAQNITSTTNEDASVSIKLLATDPDGSALTYRLLTQPTRGAVLNFIAGAGTLTYTPATNFSGADSFQYVARDGTVDSAARTVTINVATVNDAPVTFASSAQTNQGTPVEIQMLAQDIDGDLLSYTIVIQPVRGSLVNLGGNRLRYTPSAGYSGADTFSFKANDGRVDSNVSLVSIAITLVPGPSFIPSNATMSIDGFKGCAVTVDNKVKCWTMFPTLSSATEVPGITDAVAIAISDSQNPRQFHSCVLTKSGGVKCWGDNEYGQLGSGKIGGPTVLSTQAIDVVGLQSGVKSIVVNAYYGSSCALLTIGVVKCWGMNSGIPTQLPNFPSSIKFVTPGPEWFVGLTADGSMTYAGRGYNSVRIPDGSGFVSASTGFLGGYPHTCGLTTAGSVNCSIGDIYVKADLKNLQGGITALGSGGACAITANNVVKCWFSLITDNITLRSTTSPIDIVGLPIDVAAVANTQYGRACVVTKSNKIKCWERVNNGTYTRPVDLVGF